MTNFTDIRDFLRAHCARYPELALQDVFKALYQSAFGCEHLIADPSAAADYIRAEAAQELFGDGPQGEERRLFGLRVPRLGG